MTASPGSADISVVIPLHDKAAHISQALDSVRAQTVAPAETIVVDDASCDAGPEIARASGLPNLRMLRREVPGPGGYAARNVGAGAAKARWIAFLDADDTWKPGHLEAVSAILSAHPDAGVVFMSYEKTGPRGVSVRREVDTDRWLDLRACLALFAERDIFHTNGAVIDRDLYARAGGFPEAKGFGRGGDSDFWLRLIVANGGAFLGAAVTSSYHSQYSGVLSKISTVGAQHPVRRTVARLIAEGADPSLTPLLKRLANRKTLQWVRPLPNRRIATKLQLLGTLYPAVLGRDDLRGMARSFLKNW
ncbi:MAG: glycosyltransferase family 2 protein [Rhodobacteraceae bacterium]|nr:glycosyltransferase family 2 protein [Paracoccaceae bacterium]